MQPPHLVPAGNVPVPPISALLTAGIQQETGSTNSWGWCLINMFSRLTAPPHILQPGRMASNQGQNVKTLWEHSCLCRCWHTVLFVTVSGCSPSALSFWKGASLSMLAHNLAGEGKKVPWIFLREIHPRRCLKVTRKHKYSDVLLNKLNEKPGMLYNCMGHCCPWRCSFRLPAQQMSVV